MSIPIIDHMQEILTEPSQSQINLAEQLRKLNYKQTTYCYINPFGFITKNHSYCALGGIAKNLGLSNFSILISPERVRHTIESSLNMSDDEKNQIYKCPMCIEKRRLIAMIPHLNDSHKLNWKEISEKIAVLHYYKVRGKQPNRILEIVRVWYNRALNN